MAAANGTMVAEASTNSIALSAGLMPDFRTDIFAGEEFLVPPAIIGTYRGEQSAGSYSLHRYILDSLLPRLPAGQTFPTLGYAYYFDGNVPGTQSEADVLASAASRTSSASRPTSPMPCGFRKPATGAGMRNASRAARNPSRISCMRTA